MKWPFKKKIEERAEEKEEGIDALIKAIMRKESVTKEEALAIPSLSACIDLIAGIISSIPIKLYKQEEGRTIEITKDERLEILNREPGDTLTAKQMWRQLVEDYYLDRHGGNAYIEKEGTKLKSLRYVEPQKISILKNNDAIFKSYIMYVDDAEFFPFEMFRILRKTKDGAYSTSIIEEKTEMIAAVYNEMKMETALVKRGGNKKGFLQSESKIEKEDFDRIKEAYRAMYTNNEENVMVLNKGIKFQESSNTSVEMQMNETKKTNADEMAKIFRISPPMLKGSAQQTDIDNTIKFCIMPILTDIECSLDRYLLLEKEKKDRYFAFDTKEITRGNIKERYEAYQIGLKNHFLQPDEVRDKEDMEALGLDFIELGLNSVLYDIKTKSVYTPNTDKTTKIGKGSEQNDTGGIES